MGQKLARDRDNGVRNLVEGWKDPKGRTRRLIHRVAMLAADAGFLATAGTAPDDDRSEGRAGGGSSVSTHRTWAISASSVATAATLMMWLWKG